MAKKLIDDRDVRFVLFEQLHAVELLGEEIKEDYDQETLDMVIGEAAKLARSELAACNQDGDRLGCRFEDGRVYVPESFTQAYRLVCEGGWNVISDSLGSGGQGLPKAVELCCREYFQAANIAFTNFLNLTHGAAKLVEIFGSDAQRDLYLEKMFTGQWCGTMCLTEPQAGTDVGAVKTVATPKGDGSYGIKGSKLFITGGDHGLTDNIIHMVLARVKGDPSGTGGLSLFVVPKILVEGDDAGQPNDVECIGLEEKMGCHGSATCTLSFGENDACRGWLIGEQRQGIRVMFHMMNEARQLVGLQGVSMASAAYLEALAYAQERLQGPHFTQARNSEAPSVPISEHPDIRFSLMKMKAYVEGLRGLLYYHGSCMDQAALAQTPEEKARWQGRVELLTPVCKAFGTDRGFDVCTMAVQVLGGYGYTVEFPVEQYLRDVKITSIYEGANGIQAIDLLTRKITMGKGAALASFIEDIKATMAQARQIEGLALYADLLGTYKDLLAKASEHLVGELHSEAAGMALAKASRYLDFFGEVTLAWQWLWQMTLAAQKLAAHLKASGVSGDGFDPTAPPDGESAFYAGKVATGKFYLERIMPLAQGRFAEITSGGEDYLSLAMRCM